ncbi:MAG TPA: enoyl-CoA hydratase-related protein [Methylomirabilota bacterium]|nr:enoyl-CoA hydratase-related protein [Methylomirabilota bacterium]
MRRIDVGGVAIVAIDGACVGHDFERALDADIRLADATATFGADGVADVEGCARRLTRLLGEARAKEIVLGGRPFDAAAALRLGVVTRVLPPGELGDAVTVLADTLAALPPLAVRAVREAVRATRDLTPDAGLALEHAHFTRLIASRDHKAAVEAFFERRTAVFTGE